jgi:Fe-S cluster biogenesis protein NfuA
MIQTETTPNPDSLKFLSEKTLSTIGTEEFKKEKENEIKIPFVKELLNFKGVELILLSEKFLSVKKTKEVSWNELKPMIISHLNDYFEKNNEPILKEDNKTAENNDDKDETVNKIIEVLDTKIRPAVARDGGDIKFKSFENGVVKVQLQGSCSGCPSSLMTLKQGVQNLLKHYVKEVNSVEAVQ